MAKPKRSNAAIEGSEFVFLHSEGPEQTGLTFMTLWRYVQQGRLEAFGSPLKSDLKHLREQQKNDFPKLKKTQAA